MYICLCRAVTHKQINAAIEAGCDSIKAVGQACHAGTDCGSCKPEIGDLLKEGPSRHSSSPPRPQTGSALHTL